MKTTYSPLARIVGACFLGTVVLAGAGVAAAGSASAKGISPSLQSHAISAPNGNASDGARSNVFDGKVYIYNNTNTSISYQYNNADHIHRGSVSPHSHISFLLFRNNWSNITIMHMPGGDPIYATSLVSRGDHWENKSGLCYPDVVETQSGSFILDVNMPRPS